LGRKSKFRLPPCDKKQDGAPLMPIGISAKKAGISRQSLQYYIMVGLLEPVEVTSSGRRMFDEDAVKRIKLIKRLNDSGYPLRAIRELFLEGTSVSSGQNPRSGRSSKSGFAKSRKGSPKKGTRTNLKGSKK